MLKGLRLVTRVLFFLSAAWFILATPLLAEDIAHRRIVGFSPDGNYFAFEQSGIRNRSGEAYAHIFIIDTKRNRWVEGSPYRETAAGRRGLRQARRKARDAARPTLQKLRIRRKGVLLASNPITEINSHPHRIAIMTRRTIRALDKPLVFSIREVPVRTPRCRALTDERIMGMVISVRRQGGREIELHRDERIPRSRGCPTSYRIEDIIRLKKRGGGAVYAVTYSFTRSGKDGEERRYIAGGWHDDSGNYDEPDHYSDLYDYSGRPDFLDEARELPFDDYDDRVFTRDGEPADRYRDDRDRDRDDRWRDGDLDRDDDGYRDIR